MYNCAVRTVGRQFREGERDTQKVPSDELVGFRAVSMWQIPAFTEPVSVSRAL
jgi:hypothetical protein